MNETLKKELEEKIRAAGFSIENRDEPDMASGATRDNGDVGEEKPGKEDILRAKRLIREIEKEYPNVRGTWEDIDEWVSVDFRIYENPLPSRKPSQRKLRELLYSLKDRITSALPKDWECQDYIIESLPAVISICGPKWAKWDQKHHHKLTLSSKQDSPEMPWHIQVSLGRLQTTLPTEEDEKEKIAEEILRLIEKSQGMKLCRIRWYLGNQIGSPIRPTGETESGWDRTIRTKGFLKDLNITEYTIAIEAKDEKSLWIELGEGSRISLEEAKGIPEFPEIKIQKRIAA